MGAGVAMPLRAALPLLVFGVGSLVCLLTTTPDYSRQLCPSLKTPLGPERTFEYFFGCQ